MRVLIACGGTGGHINPGLAIADIIKKKYPDTEFLFAGTPKGMESKLVPKAGYRLETIKVAGFQRKISLENIGRNAKALAYLATSGRRAKQIIEGFKPDLAIGTGGYAAGPVIRKAARMGIPTAIHEQNAYPGVTTQLRAKEVSHVMLTVEDALKYFEPGIKYTVTGLPVFCWTMDTAHPSPMGLMPPHLSCRTSSSRSPVMQERPKAFWTWRSVSVVGSTARNLVSSSGVRYSRCLSGTWNRSSVFNPRNGLYPILPSLRALLNMALTVSPKWRKE